MGRLGCLGKVRFVSQSPTPHLTHLLPMILNISQLISPGAPFWGKEGASYTISPCFTIPNVVPPGNLPPYQGPRNSPKLCPLQEVIGSTRLSIRIRVPFSMQDLSQIKQDLGKFSDDPEKYLDKFRRLTVNFE